MPSKALTIGAPLILGLAALLQFFLIPILTTVLGFGRTVQKISEFPAYECRKIVHPLLEACEDLYLDQTDRKLYAACSAPETRTAYQPTVNRLNVSGRIGNDRFVVLDIDHPGAKKDYGPQRISTHGYTGAIASKPGQLDLHGFDVEETTPGGPKLRFFVVNHRPPVDAATGAPLDASKTGCNSSIEVFELTRGSTELHWQRTVWQPDVIKTPNRVTATGEGGFVATNDHRNKVGFDRPVALFTGSGGSLAYCGLRQCHIATDENIHSPNGLTRSPHDGLYYVPSSGDGIITVWRLDPPGTTPQRRLRKVATITTGMPMDNLVVDRDGAIWAAGFPKATEILAGFDNPRTATTAATALKIERLKTTGEGGKEVFEYKVTKVVEDVDGEVLPGTTTVLHDAKTGRIFFGGVYSPWISVCEPK